MSDNAAIIFLIAFAVYLVWMFRYLGRIGRWRKPLKDLNLKELQILASKVKFYKNLHETEMKLFEFKVAEFLENIKFTGIGVKVTLADRLLVAASAVIPIFRFPGWQYLNLKEVLLYPDSFDENFDFNKDDYEDGDRTGNIGMVGNGPMNDKMILSKPDLHWGFAHEWAGSNVGIHEFVHLIDKADGSVDGIPRLFLDKKYIIPWLDLIHKNIEEIYKGRSDINPYGAKNKTEFFAVVSEYFFENPEKFKVKHAELYSLMQKIFRTKVEDD